VAHINTLPETETVGAVFREGFVEAEGFPIRYTEAGEGPRRCCTCTGAADLA
jgi:hypothetical protein